MPPQPPRPRQSVVHLRIASVIVSQPLTRRDVSQCCGGRPSLRSSRPTPPSYSNQRSTAGPPRTTTTPFRAREDYEQWDFCSSCTERSEARAAAIRLFRQSYLRQSTAQQPRVIFDPRATTTDYECNTSRTVACCGLPSPVLSVPVFNHHY